MIGLKQAQLQRKTIRERMKDEGREEIIMEIIKNPNITVEELINKYPTPNITKGK